MSGRIYPKSLLKERKMQDPNIKQALAKKPVEFQNELTKARERLKTANAINGTVIKPFKSEAGVRELFFVNEPVVVMESSDGEFTTYNVEGLTYDYKKNKVGNKTAFFDGEKLLKYVKYAK